MPVFVRALLVEVSIQLAAGTILWKMQALFDREILFFLVLKCTKEISYTNDMKQNGNSPVWTRLSSLGVYSQSFSGCTDAGFQLFHATLLQLQIATLMTSKFHKFVSILVS